LEEVQGRRHPRRPLRFRGQARERSDHEEGVPARPGTRGGGGTQALQRPGDMVDGLAKGLPTSATAGRRGGRARGWLASSSTVRASGCSRTP
jgi:hypothetical protein